MFVGEGLKKKEGKVQRMTFELSFEEWIQSWHTGQGNESLSILAIGTACSMGVSQNHGRNISIDECVKYKVESS